jgi:hypothetical protein
MGPEVGVGLVLKLHEAGWVLVVLHNPAAPEVGDALLVARGADDGHSVQIDGFLDGVGGLSGLAVNQNGVTLEQHLFEEVVHIFLGFDNALGHHLASNSAHVVHVGVPELGGGLLLEPLLHHQQTVHHTGCPLAVPTGLVRRLQHRICDDRAVWLGDLVLLNLVRDNLLDLVLQAQADLGDFLGVDRGWVDMFAASGQD